MTYQYDPNDKFGYKDTLPENHPEKVVTGVEFDDEFKKIETGISDLKLEIEAIVDGGSISEAPADGLVYGRKDKSWVEVSGAGGGIEEAPETGKPYARKDKSWVESVEADHTHDIADVDGLQGEIDGLAPIDHTHEQGDVDGLELRLEAIEDSITSGGGFVDAPDDGKLYGRQSEAWEEVVIPDVADPDWSDIQNKPTEFPPSDHNHDGDYAPIDHNHNGDYALIDHNHSQYLEDAPNDGKLYGRQSENWAEVVIPDAADPDWADIQNKPTEFAPEAHDHAIANVTGLQGALDDKADADHTHEIADVNGLQDALDNAGGGVGEAPEDGVQYARRDAAWEPVSAVHVGDDEPASPVTGQLWYKPTDDEMYVYDGSDWKSFGSGGDGGNGGDTGLGEAILVVGGGGQGGGIYAGGGGGGGGVVLVEQAIEVSGLYQVVVGSGEGASTIAQSNGSPSSVTGPNTSVSAEGGGSGGNYNLRDGRGVSGSSGGGHCYSASAGAALAQGIDGQGFEGGGKPPAGIGSGGGGAGQPGAVPENTSAGRGGDGKQYDLTGTMTHYAGGGAGGLQATGGPYGQNVEGSLGGGGNWLGTGGVSSSGKNGLGGGGAGCTVDGGNGGSGGSGVVIFRTKRTLDLDNYSSTIQFNRTLDGFNVYTFPNSVADVEFQV